MTTSTPRSPGWVRSRIRYVLLLLVALIGAGAVVRSRLAPVPVVVTPVMRGKAIDAVYATGTVETEDRVQVKAKSSGSVAEVLVKEGSAVKKGDLLARIDNPGVAFDLKRGEADLSAASAQAGPSAPQIASLRAQAKMVDSELAMARQDLARFERLAGTGVLPQVEADRARARVVQLESSLAANEAQQRALRIDLSANAARQSAQVKSLAARVTDTEVRSPLDGVVLQKSVEVGEVVAVNQTLFKVGDVKSLILEVAVDEADIARVVAGDPAGSGRGSSAAVSLYAFSKQVFRGHVFEVLPDANRERKAFLAKVRLSEPPAGLRSGMSAEVNIIVGEHDGALLAPSEAEERGAVWVVRGGVAQRQPVVIGVRDLLRFEVIEGLAEGDAVVVEGQAQLAPGKRVSVTERSADKAAPVPDRSQPQQSSL
jgi:HlyD family secretion protein